MPRPKSYIVKDPAILAKRNFAFGAAVEIIENGFGDPLAGDRAEVFYAYNFR
jgi:hypothetical protein